MKIEKSSLLSAAACFFFLGLIGVGLFPQSAADPLMMLPFATLSIALIATNRLTKLEIEPLILLPLLMLWLSWIVSGLTSTIPFPSKVTLMIFATLPVATLTAQNLKFSPLHFLGWLALPFAGYTLWEAMNGVIRPQSPFEDSNLLGLFFALSTLSLFPHLASGTKKPIRMIAALIALTLTAALIVTQSRSALLCLLAGALVFGLLTLRARPNLSRTTWASLGGGLVGVIALTFATGLADRFVIWSNGTLDANITGRLAIWKAAATMATQHPLTGFGLGTFHLYYPQFRLNGDNSQGWMAHMDPLQSAIECGWLSAVALYLVFIAAALLVIKHRKVLTPIQTTSATILTAFFIAMHLNYPLHSVPFLMICGCALATLTFPNTKKQIPLALSWGLLITLLSSLWILFQATMTLMLLTESKMAANLHNQERFDKAISACLTDGDKDFPDCRIMAAKFMIMAQTPDKERILKLLDDAEVANPVSPETPYQRALLESQQTPSSDDRILAYLQLSLTRNPAYWPARRMAIGIYVTRKEPEKAKALLQSGMIYRYAPPTRNDIRRVSKELGIDLK